MAHNRSNSSGQTKSKPMSVVCACRQVWRQAGTRWSSQRKISRTTNRVLRFKSRCWRGNDPTKADFQTRTGDEVSFTNESLDPNRAALPPDVRKVFDLPKETSLNYWG